MLRIRPRVLLLDEPTQGVDVAATAEINSLVHAVAADGAAVLVCSSDEEELAHLCSTVLVLRSGEVAAILTGEDVTAPAIIAQSLRISDEDYDDQLAQALMAPVAVEGGRSI